MDGDLDQHLATQINKQKVPLVIVDRKEKADYILTGKSVGLKRKWHQASADKNQGTVTLLEAKSKKEVWTATEGDGSFWLGRLGKTGTDKWPNAWCNNCEGISSPRPNGHGGLEGPRSGNKERKG